MGWPQYSGSRGRVEGSERQRPREWILVCLYLGNEHIGGRSLAGGAGSRQWGVDTSVVFWQRVCPQLPSAVRSVNGEPADVNSRAGTSQGPSDVMGVTQAPSGSA